MRRETMYSHCVACSRGHRHYRQVRRCDYGAKVSWSLSYSWHKRFLLVVPLTACVCFPIGRKRVVNGHMEVVPARWVVRWKEMRKNHWISLERNTHKVRDFSLHLGLWLLTLKKEKDRLRNDQREKDLVQITSTLLLSSETIKKVKS